MSLRRIYDNRVFDDATSDERRARVYVGSGELGLTGDDRPCSQSVVSPSRVAPKVPRDDVQCFCAGSHGAHGLGPIAPAVAHTWIWRAHGSGPACDGLTQ